MENQCVECNGEICVGCVEHRTVNNKFEKEIDFRIEKLKLIIRHQFNV